ncbi:hypothetical protein [Gallaecimonas sp. GXIMD4217]|uniref:HAD family hydrolase n=1 Tax=Gallaecimonas sp. GXIMD4217 TaxID=3131927 RepID=UPI00311B38C9
MLISIPGRESIEINNVILDFNGTIAIDGKLIAGVADKINALSKSLRFYVVTADTYGTAERELAGVDCQVVNLSTSQRYGTKSDVLSALGKNETLCVGNGFNDREILKDCALGVALLQAEGLCVDALLAADLVCQSIIDVLSCLEQPNRIRASLRA